MSWVCELSADAEKDLQRSIGASASYKYSGNYPVSTSSLGINVDPMGGDTNATIRSMFHVVLECDAEGLSPEIGEQAAMDIAEEFSHRPWHTDVRCIWDGRCLRLEADNDYDEKGLALRDEFSDAMAACVAMYGRIGDMRIVSVTEF